MSYAEKRTPLARRIDDITAHQKKLLGLFHSFADHLNGLVSFLAKASTDIRFGDWCHTCGIEGREFRLALQALARIEKNVTYE